MTILTQPQVSYLFYAQGMEMPAFSSSWRPESLRACTHRLGQGPAEVATISFYFTFLSFGKGLGWNQDDDDLMRFR